MCAGTGARRSRPTCPQRGPCRCKHSAKRGMAGVPHLGNTPQHPMRSPACPGSRAWRLASRLAVPRIAYTLTLLPRSSATALLGAGSPGAVAVPIGSPSRRVAHGHTHYAFHGVWRTLTSKPNPNMTMQERSCHHKFTSLHVVTDAAIRTLLAFGTRRLDISREIVNIASRSGHRTCMLRSAP